MRVPCLLVGLLVAAAAARNPRQAPLNKKKYLLCHEYDSHVCQSWILSPRDLESNDYFISNRYKACGLSDLRPLRPNKHLYKISSLKLDSLIIPCRYINVVNEYKTKSTQAPSRHRRSPRGKFRGQTQSQYLSIDQNKGNGDEGKAEALSAADSSRAVVSGRSGMGQAQSQTMYDPSCDDCYNENIPQSLRDKDQHRPWGSTSNGLRPQPPLHFGSSDPNYQQLGHSPGVNGGRQQPGFTKIVDQHYTPPTVTNGDYGSGSNFRPVGPDRTSGSTISKPGILGNNQVSINGAYTPGRSPAYTGSESHQIGPGTAQPVSPGLGVNGYSPGDRQGGGSNIPVGPTGPGVAIPGSNMYIPGGYTPITGGKSGTIGSGGIPGNVGHGLVGVNNGVGSNGRFPTGTTITQEGVPGYTSPSDRGSSDHDPGRTTGTVVGGNMQPGVNKDIYGPKTGYPSYGTGIPNGKTWIPGVNSNIDNRIPSDGNLSGPRHQYGTAVQTGGNINNMKPGMITTDANGNTYICCPIDPHQLNLHGINLQTVGQGKQPGPVGPGYQTQFGPQGPYSEIGKYDPGELRYPGTTYPGQGSYRPEAGYPSSGQQIPHHQGPGPHVINGRIHGTDGSGIIAPGVQGPSLDHGRTGGGMNVAGGEGTHRPGLPGAYIPGVPGSGRPEPDIQVPQRPGGGVYVPSEQSQVPGRKDAYLPTGHGAYAPGGQISQGTGGQTTYGPGGLSSQGPDGQGSQGIGGQGAPGGEVSYKPVGQDVYGPGRQDTSRPIGQGTYAPGQGVYGPGGQDVYGPGGQGVYGPGGQGIYKLRGQGAYGPGQGQNEYGSDGQGPYIPRGQGNNGIEKQDPQRHSTGSDVPQGTGQSTYIPSRQGASGPGGLGPYGTGGQGAYSPEQGSYSPGSQGTYSPGSQVTYGPGGQGTYGSRDQETYGPGGQGTYAPGGQGSYAPGGQATYAPGDQRAYSPGSQGAYAPGSQGAYAPGGQGGYGPGPQDIYGHGGQVARVPGGQGPYRPGGQGIYVPGGQGLYEPGGLGAYGPGGQEASLGPGGQGTYGPGGQGAYGPGRQTAYEPAGQGAYGPGGQSAYGSGGHDVNGPRQGSHGLGLDGGKIGTDGTQVQTAQNGGHEGVPQNFLDPNLIASDDDSEALATVNQGGNGTVASASSKGGNEKGRAQTQVQGTYSGSGSFSAQAQITDDSKGAESQVTGSKEGASSSAQGRGRNNKSQAQVELGSETGSVQTNAQSEGVMHSSNSQVQGGVKGGMADAQARGPGSTSSQAQIGFTPFKEGDKSHDQFKTPFYGGGSASAQSSGRTGQSQSQLQGTFKYGIQYNGAAQAGASIDKDTVFPNRLPFNKIDVFDETNKNIYVNTLDTSTPVADKSTNIEPIDRSETKTIDHPHSEHHNSGTQSPINSRRSFHHNRERGSEYEYTTSKFDNTSDDYDGEGSFGAEGVDAEPEYTNYDDFNHDLTHQPIQSANKKGLEVKQSSGGNTQHIILGSLRGHNAEITQHSSEQRPDESRIYQPGERVPGTGGYTIPLGFTGSVKSVASKSKTYAIGSKDSPSQAQTVALSPGTGKIKYVYSKPSPISPKDLKSLLPKKNDDNRYMSVSKSVSGALDGDNNIKKQYSHTYYTKSSSCGYFTFTCTIVSGSNGRKKVCKPKIPTNPDGTPMNC